MLACIHAHYISDSTNPTKANGGSTCVWKHRFISQLHVDMWRRWLEWVRTTNSEPHLQKEPMKVQHYKLTTAHKKKKHRLIQPFLLSQVSPFGFLKELYAEAERRNIKAVVKEISHHHSVWDNSYAQPFLRAVKLNQFKLTWPLRWAGTPL